MKSELIAVLTKVLIALNYPNIPIVIQLPKNPKHGDFSTNLAMQLSGKLKSNPRDIAKSIIEILENDYPLLVKSAEVVNPGFININIQNLRNMSWTRCEQAPDDKYLFVFVIFGY